jgi:hypothetical protein
MVNSDTFLDFIIAEPFRPFRVQLATGEAFEVRHPELVYVGVTNATIHSSYLVKKASGDMQRQWHDVPLDAVTAIEPIVASLN